MDDQLEFNRQRASGEASIIADSGMQGFILKAFTRPTGPAWWLWLHNDGKSSS